MAFPPEFSHVAAQAPPRGHERGGAHHGAADAQHDDDYIPERALVVEEREVEAVQSLVQPAPQPPGIVRPQDDPASSRIDVEPRCIRILVADPQHRKRPRPPGIVVVVVELVQPYRVPNLRPPAPPRAATRSRWRDRARTRAPGAPRSPFPACGRTSSPRPTRTRRRRARLRLSRATGGRRRSTCASPANASATASCSIRADPDGGQDVERLARIELPAPERSHEGPHLQLPSGFVIRRKPIRRRPYGGRRVETTEELLKSSSATLQIRGRVTPRRGTR